MKLLKVGLVVLVILQIIMFTSVLTSTYFGREIKRSKLRKLIDEDITS